ncbi:hypothetical protein ACHAXR_004269 [Thalassiosira sp. AJA248-18]
MPRYFALSQIRHSSTAVSRNYYTSLQLRKTTSTADGIICAKSKNDGGSAPSRQPIFGIVAALTKSGVIGINGALPWDPIPQDLDHFIKLTRNKILIVGRKSFAEDPTGAHINHVRVCIVVSKTMNEITNGMDRSGRSTTIGGYKSGPKLKLARSFDEALDLASHESLLHANLETQSGNTSTDNDKYYNDAYQNEDGEIDCWVAGGERIYKEALLHENANEVHLTHVDMDVKSETPASATAYFPMEFMTRGGFEECSRVHSGVCTFCLYKRRLPWK